MFQLHSPSMAVFPSPWMHEIFFKKNLLRYMGPTYTFSGSFPVSDIFETGCIVTLFLVLSQIVPFLPAMLQKFSIWTQIWVFKATTLFWITCLTVLLNHAGFLLIALKYFLNNITHLFRVMVHLILHQKQEIC